MQWNFDSGAPIYAQLVAGIRLRIIMGEYPAGSRIPPVRELAMEAGVNPNTMQRAFQELERLGLVISCRTNGRYVTEDVGIIEEARLSLARRHVREFYQQMQSMGYDVESICELLMHEMMYERSGEDGTDSGVS